MMVLLIWMRLHMKILNSSLRHFRRYRRQFNRTLNLRRKQKCLVGFRRASSPCRLQIYRRRAVNLWMLRSTLRRAMNLRRLILLSSSWNTGCTFWRLRAHGVFATTPKFSNFPALCSTISVSISTMSCALVSCFFLFIFVHMRKKLTKRGFLLLFFPLPDILFCQLRVLEHNDDSNSQTGKFGFPLASRQAIENKEYACLFFFFGEFSFGSLLLLWKQRQAGSAPWSSARLASHFVYAH